MGVNVFNLFVAGRISFGPGVSGRIGDLARSLGAERAVLVTDERMERLGISDRIAGIMEKEGVETCIFAGVEPEPSVETTDAVAMLAREHDCQLVVGLGGGSCMDVAKAVSVLITNEGSGPFTRDWARETARRAEDHDPDDRPGQALR